MKLSAEIKIKSKAPTVKIQKEVLNRMSYIANAVQ